MEGCHHFLLAKYHLALLHVRLCRCLNNYEDNESDYDESEQGVEEIVHAKGHTCMCFLCWFFSPDVRDDWEYQIRDK